MANLGWDTHAVHLPTNSILHISFSHCDIPPDLLISGIEWNNLLSSLPLGKPMALKSPKSESEWKTLNELRELCSRRGYYLGTTCMKKKDDMVTAVLEVQLPELRVTRSAIDKNTKEAKGKLCFPCYVRSKTSEYLVRYSCFQQREIEKIVDELLQQGFAAQLAPMHRLSSWSRIRTGAGGSASIIELSIHKL